MCKKHWDRVAHTVECYLRYSVRTSDEVDIIHRFSGLRNATRRQKTQARAKLVKARAFHVLKEVSVSPLGWRVYRTDEHEKVKRRLREAIIMDLEAFFAQQEGYGADNRWFYQ